MFDKSARLFPSKNRYTYLAHCGISPLYGPAGERAADMCRAQVAEGCMVFSAYDQVLEGLRSAAAGLMATAPENLAFVKNTSEGMSLVANGFPLEGGDEIVSYVHEYPANHYPWKLQERRGARLRLLPNRDLTGTAPQGAPSGWTFEDLEDLVTDRTRIVAVSHGQFTSGFAADLPRLGAFCRERSIDLVVDAAQSLGCLPVLPEEAGISAVASSGWKWLLGPVGTGLLYTAPAFREKLAPVQVGAELMRQGQEYLNHAWNPHATAKRFEYSTSPVALAAALETCIREVGLRYGPVAVRNEIFRLQDVFLAALDRRRYAPQVFPKANRCGILALVCDQDPKQVAKGLMARGIVCSARGGYLRVAPHVENTDEQMEEAAEALNAFEAP